MRNNRMNRFEVCYKDPSMSPVPTFVVVVRARRPIDAYHHIKSLGYAPVSIKELWWGIK